MYSFIPFTILAIINTFLIQDLNQKRKSIKSENSNLKKQQMAINFSVILMTLLFIAFTSGSAVCSQFYDQLLASYTGNIILFASDCFSFSYHGLNIIIICSSNREFFRKLKEAFVFKPKGNLNVSSKHSPNTSKSLQSLSLFFNFKNEKQLGK